MKKVKLGIIGIGNMGTSHMKNILAGKCPEIDVAAVADIDPARIEAAKGLYKEAVEKNPELPEVAYPANHWHCKLKSRKNPCHTTHSAFFHSWFI